MATPLWTNGKYVSVKTSDANRYVYADTAGRGSKETFDLVNVWSVRIWDPNNYFLALKPNDATFLLTIEGGMDNDNYFRAQTVADGKIALKGPNGKYVSARTTETNVPLKSIADNIGTNAIFTVEQLGSGKVALKAANGKYVQVKSASPYYTVLANAATVANNCTFYFEIVPL